MTAANQRRGWWLRQHVQDISGVSVLTINGRSDLNLRLSFYFFFILFYYINKLNAYVAVCDPQNVFLF